MKDRNLNAESAEAQRKEKPILFSAEMVRAILEGRKTQTRRVIDMVFGDFDQKTGELLPDPDLKLSLRDGVLCEFLTPEMIARKSWMPGEQPEPGWVELVGGKGPGGRGNPVRCPYGIKGDRLWVRETYALDSGMPNGVRYSATDHIHDLRPKKSSIYMPRWASRITLEVTSVRVEQVQEISVEDAISEGAMVDNNGRHSLYGYAEPVDNFWRQSPVDAYMHLWERINAARGYGWDKNPWVWVVEFKDAALNAQPSTNNLPTP